MGSGEKERAIKYQTYLVAQCVHCLAGLVFCEKCSSRSLMMTRLGSTKAQRVCDECYLLLRTTEVLAKIERLQFGQQEQLSSLSAPPSQQQQIGSAASQQQADTTAVVS